MYGDTLDGLPGLEPAVAGLPFRRASWEQLDVGFPTWDIDLTTSEVRSSRMSTRWRNLPYVSTALHESGELIRDVETQRALELLRALLWKFECSWSARWHAVVAVRGGIEQAIASLLEERGLPRQAGIHRIDFPTAYRNLSYTAGGTSHRPGEEVHRAWTEARAMVWRALAAITGEASPWRDPEGFGTRCARLEWAQWCPPLTQIDFVSDACFLAVYDPTTNRSFAVFGWMET